MKHFFDNIFGRGKVGSTVKLFIQILRFGIVGVFSTLLDYGLMILFTEVFSVYYLLSSTLSFGISVIFNYLVSMKYVFERKEDTNKWHEFLIFIGLSICGMGLNQLLLWYIVELVGIHYQLAKLLATGGVMVWNFVTRKLFLEKKK